jgi:hypothetical protein
VRWEIRNERILKIPDREDRGFKAMSRVADDERMLGDMAGKDEVAGHHLPNRVIFAPVKRVRRRDEIFMRVDGVEGTDGPHPKAEVMRLREAE